MIYDKDYYENGLATGKSTYENYRWIPELTVPLAMTIIDYLGIKRGETVLDFGCAKGYLVKAMRWLGREAYGYDISKYAIENSDSEIKSFVGMSIPEVRFSYCIAKDVFEHIEENTLFRVLLNDINADTIFAIIPLGEHGEYIAYSNNCDISHVLCRPQKWWCQFFSKCDWNVKLFSLRVNGIKDKYYEMYPESHGFFVLDKK